MVSKQGCLPKLLETEDIIKIKIAKQNHFDLGCVVLQIAIALIRLRSLNILIRKIIVLRA